MLIWIVCGLGIFMCFLFLQTGRPVRCVLGSTLGGGLSFWLLNLIAGLTGVTLPLNLASVFSAVLLGAPGICSIWLLKMLWRGQNRQKNRKSKKGPLFPFGKRGPCLCDQACKPSSVQNSNLSRPFVAERFKPPGRDPPGKRYRSLCGVASDRVYTAARSPARW